MRTETDVHDTTFKLFSVMCLCFMGTNILVPNFNGELQLLNCGMFNLVCLYIIIVFILL